MAIGIPAALAVARLLRGMFVCVPVLLIAISAAASYVPARKALRVDPVVALNYE